MHHRITCAKSDILSVNVASFVRNAPVGAQGGARVGDPEETPVEDEDSAAEVVKISDTQACIHNPGRLGRAP